MQIIGKTLYFGSSFQSEVGSGWENVRGHQEKTWGIRRSVFVTDTEEREWNCLLNKHSHLILKCQPESPQALIPLWFESVEDYDKFGNFIGIINSPYPWACDAEFYSKYKMKKDELNFEHRRYLLDHPEVSSLLGDYLQAVLFRKPQNVIEFTQQYFETFLNMKGKRARMKMTAQEGDYSPVESASYHHDSGSEKRSGAETSIREDLRGESENSNSDTDRLY